MTHPADRPELVALRDEVASLLCELIAIPSVNPAFRRAGDPESWYGERAIGDFTAGWLQGLGLHVETREVLPNRCNVLAYLPGSNRSRRLLWEAHVDTVQPHNMVVEPFSARREADRIYGRGAADVKGGLAAMMVAIKRLVESGREPGCDLCLAAVVDEEYQYKGVLDVIARGPDFDAAVVAEPTGLEVATACKAVLRWRTVVKGRAAHSSQPEEGVNAITAASRLLAFFAERLEPLHAARAHPLVGKPTLTCTMIEGGSGPNTVPDRCALTFDRRLVPGESADKVWDEIHSLARGFGESFGAGIDILMEEPFVADMPMALAHEEEVVRVAGAAVAEVGGRAAPIGVPFGCDASKIAHAGRPAIVFGPGSIDQAHGAAEFIDIDQLVRAVRVLEVIAERFGIESAYGRTS